MIKSLYRASSGMLVRQTRMDIIANNLANVNTSGFKRSEAFARLMLKSYPVEGALIGKHDMHSNSLEEYTDFALGPVEHTGNKLDLAIKGRGFFEVQDSSGNTYLTRNGNFYLNAQNQLVDANGNSVQGEGGEISLPEGKSISINDRGEVIAGEQVIARFKIVDVDNLQELEKAGNSYYTVNNTGMEIIDNAEFITESLERSNVNASYEMINMIDIQRGYEANQKVVHMSDQTLDRLIREVGRGIV